MPTQFSWFTSLIYIALQKKNITKSPIKLTCPPKNWTISKGTFIFQPLTSWWLNQPLWTICIKLGSSSPSFGVKIPNIFELPPPRLIFPGLSGFSKSPFLICQVSGVNISGPKALRSWVSSLTNGNQIGSVQFPYGFFLLLLWILGVFHQKKKHKVTKM